MKISKIFIVIGICLLTWYGSIIYTQKKAEGVTLEETKNYLEEDESERSLEIKKPEVGSPFGMFYVQKLDKEIAVVEGTDYGSLAKGAGHMVETAMPSEGEQIIVSGHRDTVFKEFSKLELGDIFLLKMPYGEYKYEIRDTKIVDEYDTTIVGKMGEEVLLVTTCYPFNYLGAAPQRFIFYAYPID